MKQSENDRYYEKGYREGYQRREQETKDRVKNLEELLKMYLGNKNACLCDHCLSERIKLKELNVPYI